ncbi:MAG: hypothetical protein KIT14_02210 [bacterium]|nr:hypothetical protein [bacterium]
MVAIALQTASPSPVGPAGLREFAAIAAKLEISALSVETAEFADRVAAGLFYVACVGPLTRPLAESQQRITALRQVAASAEHSLRAFGSLLTAEESRLRAQFVERQQAFRMRVGPAAQEELRSVIGAGESHSRVKRWRDAHQVAQHIYRRLLDSWRQEEQPIAEAAYRSAMKWFVDLANDFLARVVSQSGGQPAEIPPVLEAGRGFHGKSGIYFTELIYITSRSPARWFSDLFRLPGFFTSTLMEHPVDYLDRLIVANSTRVTSDLDDQVRESHRRLEQELRERIRDGYGIAERTLQRAQVQQRRGAEATAEERERLTAAREAIRAILQRHGYAP